MPRVMIVVEAGDRTFGFDASSDFLAPGDLLKVHVFGIPFGSVVERPHRSENAAKAMSRLREPCHALTQLVCNLIGFGDQSCRGFG